MPAPRPHAPGAGEPARTLAGRSGEIQRLREQVRHLAATRAPVLLEGEPGTGKSVVARALHYGGPRRERRFERVDCGALPEALQAAALFGAEGRPGAFERANGGSLLLHEIDRASADAQVRLLHFLQERTIERTDAPQPAAGSAPGRGPRGSRAEHGSGSARVPVDVRLIAASDRDLAGEVHAGRFRDDLYHLLAVTRVQLPPLRSRREDLPLLVGELVRAANREHGRRVPGVTVGVLERFARHDWPGNVAELRRTLDGMVAAARGRRRLDLEDLPDALSGADEPGGRLALTVGMTLASAERQLVEATLAYTGGDKRRAAALLGMGLRTLYRRLDEWGGG
jgi:DNA-binding NtrC family response regulator